MSTRKPRRSGAPARGALALVKGTERPDVSGSAVADTQLIAPMKPKAVKDSKELSAVWDELVPEMDKAGLLARTDAMALEMAIRHFVMARRASMEIEDEDLTILDVKNDRVAKNPKEAIFRMESKEFLEYAKQLGMTFMARARTPSSSSGDSEEDNPFAGTGG